MKYLTITPLLVALCVAGCTPAEPPGKDQTVAEQPPKADPDELAATVKLAAELVAKLGGTVQYKGGKLTGVDLLGIPASDADVEVICKVPGIKKLKLWGAEITGDSMKNLATLEHLTELHLENADVANDDVARLKTLAGLKSLSLRRCS
ncbi:MAG: hypothetical protein V3V75_03675, partial [Thermoguttaceae bacterium]